MGDVPRRFRFTGQPLNGHLIANVGSLLDAKGIPHVLWHLAPQSFRDPDSYRREFPSCHSFGMPLAETNQAIALVLGDEALQRAYDTLQSAGFSPCSLGESCEDSKQKRPRFSPAPSEHLHISDDSCIMLFGKSEVLWNIPDLATVLSETTAKPDVILASDPIRASRS